MQSMTDKKRGFETTRAVVKVRDGAGMFSMEAFD